MLMMKVFRMNSKETKVTCPLHEVTMVWEPPCGIEAGREVCSIPCETCGGKEKDKGVYHGTSWPKEDDVTQFVNPLAIKSIETDYPKAGCLDIEEDAFSIITVDSLRMGPFRGTAEGAAVHWSACMLQETRETP